MINLRTYSTALLVGLLSMSTWACEKAADPRVVVLHEEDGYQAGWQRYRDSAMAGPDGTLVVEDDLVFESEQDLQAYFDERTLEDRDKAHAFQNSESDYIPAYEFPNSVDIKYCVSDNFGADKATWVSRIAQATADWTRIVNVRFRYLSEHDDSCSADTDEVDFAAVRRDGINLYCGASKLIWSGGCPTSNGVIDTGVLLIDPARDVTNGGSRPNMTPVGVLRHELGHILGLRHEHPWGSFTCQGEVIDYPAEDITGVQLGHVAYDSLSVMHYPDAICGGNPQGTYAITNADSNSVQVLYGMQPAWFVAFN